MTNFLITLKFRNALLFYFGLSCLAGAILFLIASRLNPLMIKGANAWYKPFKFAISIGIFSWTMAWFTWYLQIPRQMGPYNWAIILLLGFEVFYISFQASRGQLSHYNVSSPLYTSLTILMALAALAATFYTAYIAFLFWINPLSQLPVYYTLSIRLGLLLFVIFALEGVVIGANGAHTVGGPDSSGGVLLLGWSRKFGDLRIAHFIGMHALQVLPLLSYYLLKNVRLVWLVGIAYALLASAVLIQALAGQPLFRK